MQIDMLSICEGRQRSIFLNKKAVCFQQIKGVYHEDGGYSCSSLTMLVTTAFNQPDLAETSIIYSLQAFEETKSLQIYTFLKIAFALRSGF